MTHFLLERNWKTGQATQRHRHFSSQGPHRIQIDDVEGTVIATHTNGRRNQLCVARDKF
jgi:hypothetical protein